ncbi:DUF3025 domain-containing protein [Paraburkholderia lycopersici]|uniref:DUF3025 domain-containing protein n=1 Tax=Paraburkholderia lycopersici TaxID=416944 RepID=A0A1G6GQT0_9BURK|nr:DUF3025 domain-containing protein [Paraburkholderia lycopersici]SDB84095.1 Protein of unknown function [Paraburkholderia lycopersici]
MAAGATGAPVVATASARAARRTSSGSFADIDWARPWFAQHEARGRRWQQAALAGYAAWLGELNADARAAAQSTGCGEPLRFIAQDDLPEGTAYEAHIAATGCVPTRHNLHDFFNALAWFAFPRIKSTLNARQAAALDVLGVGPTRGGVRDALTLFDENAVLYASSDAGLVAALRDFDWRALFVTGRSGWEAAFEETIGEARCEVRVIGHALLEKLIAPYTACTAHAWVVEVPDAYFTWPRALRNAYLDEIVSATLAADAVLNGRSFAPLPVLGIPGWWAQNEDPAFYDDVTVFRGGRRAR